MKNFCLFLLSLIILSCANNQTKIYQWRGENRMGIYPEKNLLKEWPEDGLKELWYTEEIGDGYGSPTITENEIYITGAIDSTATLFCLDLNGNTLWKAPFGKEWVVNYPGSRSAPTIVDDLIYIGSGMNNLYCLKRSNGEVVWEKNFTDDFGGILPRFGHSEAAVVDGDRVFWTVGGKEYNVVALNRFTGELIWSNKGFSERSGYTPGQLIELPTRHIFVTFSAYHLMGFDTETGEMLWSQEQTNTKPEERQPGIGDTHSNSVIFDDGCIYYAAGDGNGGIKLQLSEDGSQIKEVWRNAEFDSYMGAIVKIGNHIYGSGTTKKEFKSINAESGVISDSLKLGWGAVIAADDLLYYYSQNGKLSLVSYTSNGALNEISQFKITRGSREHFSHPVIKNGILYQRHGQVLMAFDIKAKG
ncbi:MAG TPA: PQQ-binding-like beta-propeller repeat protein [Draconibacterium sp.]|nr:PQQ-binding-like beta-propeller repeat protein [Draconibacterium sp.]